jgi:hypothetical protein
LLVSLLLSVPLSALANVQSRFAGAGTGDWSQNALPIGPSDGTCATIGAVGNSNDVSSFGFDVPAGETIVGVVVRPDVASGEDELVSLQLLLAGAPIGDAVDVTFPGARPTNCAASQYVSYGANDDLSFWGASLTPAQVNDASFGVRLIKLSASVIQIDTICIDVYFADGSGTSSCQSTTDTGTLRVVKDAVGGDDTFPFSVDTSPATDDDITTISGTGSFEITDVTPGLYAVSETIPADWDLVSASCDDGTSSGIGAQADGTATVADVNLNPGDTVTCTFTNTADPGALVSVSKVVNGRFPSTDWEFSSSEGDFTLPADGGSTTTPIELAPGEPFTLFEVQKPLYQASAECVDADTGASVATGSSSVSFTPGAGQQITCEFVNVFQASGVVPPRTASAIPALGHWGLMLLAGLLALIGIGRLRSGR